jgi:hypothetical protein
MLAASPARSSTSLAKPSVDALETLDALAGEAWRLEPPPPHERRSVLRAEAAALVDGLLARVARSRGALDVTIGEGLAALTAGDRLIQLGFSGIGDYGRELLGVETRTAQSMARLARELRERPILRAAVRRGEVSARKAQVVLPVARGEDEARWLARARVETVRALEAGVKAELAAGSDAADAEDDDWERISLELSPAGRATLDEAMALAGKVLGPTTPKWERLEAICMEFLGAYPPGSDDPDHAGEEVEREQVSDWLAAAKSALEEETAAWAALETVAPVPAPVTAAADDPVDPHRIDDDLRRLAAMRDRWDEVLGHLAMLLRTLGLWRELGFASLSHYCDERLGMAARTVEQRASLERRLHELPALRQALRERAVSYEQARLVARVADSDTVEAWVDRARTTTCIALRRELESADDAQMCARAELDLRVPRRVGLLLDSAIRAARAASDHWLTAAECIERIAQNFNETWKGAVRGRSTRHSRILERDGFVCQVPGCSRAAEHAHHVRFRSAGGGDEDWNQVALCLVHHLQCVHRGFVRVTGQAPFALRWTLGTSPRAGQLLAPAA